MEKMLKPNRKLKQEEMDYSNWMANLPKSSTSKPIHTIAMPVYLSLLARSITKGSHDSFSYAISWKTKIGPDEPSLAWFNYIPLFGPIVKRFIYQWWVTQEATFTHQLELGIRYFDLRLAPNPDTGCIHLLHGLYAMPLMEALEEMSVFLETHLKEVILLHFQHVYNFTNEHHNFVIDKLRQVFGAKICPVSGNVLSLQELWEGNFQVFVFYRSDKCTPDLWPNQVIPNPWPQTTEPKELLLFLERNYAKGRLKDKFYVTQGILSSTKLFGLKHLFSNLKSSLARKANHVLFAWLKGKQAGPSGLNVVMFDFVDSSIEIVQYVIQINYKEI